MSSPEVSHGSPRVEESGRTSITSKPTESVPAAQRERSLQRACCCAKVADDFRGGDTLVLDLTGVTPIVDFFVLTSGASRRQMHAIAEEVDRIMKAEGNQRMGLEGYSAGSWILQDYGDVVLHVFTSEARSTYDLENLWADAARVDWQAMIER